MQLILLFNFPWVFNINVNISKQIKMSILFFYSNEINNIKY